MLSNGLGWPHLLLIALVFMLLFGTRRLPEAAQSLGTSLKVFTKEVTARDDTTAGNPATTEAPPPPAAAAPAQQPDPPAPKHTD